MLECKVIIVRIQRVINKVLNSNRIYIVLLILCFLHERAAAVAAAGEIYVRQLHSEINYSLSGYNWSGVVPIVLNNALVFNAFWQDQRRGLGVY